MKGRIPQFFIDDLLARLDIVDVIDAYVPLKKAGSNYKACCPFHNEKSPSFTVSQEKQFFHCFGCGAHGTAIGFLMDYDRLSFPEAVEALAEIAGVEIPYEDLPVGQKQQQTEAQKVIELNKKASALFQQQLRQHKPAINYLKERGLSGQTAANFTIGYVPDSWDTLLKALGQDDNSKALLKTAGLLSENQQGRQYDKFRHRIIFPIRNRKGDVIAFGGRVISADHEPKYLNSPETPVFHKGRALYGVYELRKFAKQIDYVLVVEGYMDVVALAEQGIHTAVATLGTATTTEHIQQLLRIHHQIVFCFDGDQAGKQAAWRALNNALPALNDNAQLKFLFLPDGEDPDSLVRTEGKVNFEQRFETALPLAEYFFQELGQQIDLSQLAGKAQLANQALPLISKVTAPILKELLYKRLEDKVHLSKDKLLQLNQQSSTPEHDVEEPSNDYHHTPPAKTQQLKMDEVKLAIGALLVKPELAGEVGDIDKLSKIDNKGAAFLADMLEEIRTTPSLSTQALLQRYIGTAYEQRLANLRADFLHIHRTEEVLKQEFLDAIQGLIKKANAERYQVLLNKLQNKSITDDEKQELQYLLTKN